MNRKTLVTLCTLVLASVAYGASVTSDVAKFQRQLRSNRRFNMISRVDAVGSLTNIDPVNQKDAIFVQANNKWHRLSKREKQRTADAIFSRWKALCHKSGRVGWLYIQQKPIPQYDILAQCDEDMGCEVFDSYTPPSTYQTDR